MKNVVFDRLVNVGFRGVTMGSRFILVIALAKLLPPSELGEYGLLVVAITFSVLLVGAEFHTYTMREINTNPIEKWSFIIQHQAIAQGILFIVLFPLILLLFLFDVLPDKYIYWFSILLFLELLNQEIHWLLISMQKQILSSVVMFVRFGIWVFIVLPMMYFNSDLNNIQSVFFAWTIGGFLAVVLGSVFVKKSVTEWRMHTINKGWMIKGVKMGGYFLLAALSLKGLFTFDRFSLELLGSTDELGVYVFYIGVIIGALSFLEPAVFSFIYPKMIQRYHEKNRKEYLKLFSELAISTLLISIFLASMIWFMMPYLIQWINKPIYTEHYDSLNVLIVMGVVYVLGMVPHISLYSMKSDVWIISAQVSAVIVYLGIIIFYKNESPVLLVSIGLLVAFSWMGIIKLVGYKLAKQKTFLTGNI